MPLYKAESWSPLPEMQQLRWLGIAADYLRFGHQNRPGAQWIHFSSAWRAHIPQDTARAMSEENVEIVRRVFEAFNRGGATAVESAGFLANEVVFDGTGAEIPGVGVVRGIDAVRTFFEEDWFAAFPFEDWEIHIEEPIDNGDQVIVTSRQQGRGASSGAGTALTLGNIFTVRNGEIVRIQVFRRPEEALEAGGLSE